MANLKFTELTEDTTPTFDDLIATANDPSGTPASRKVKLLNALGFDTNPQTGTSYTVLTGDFHKIVTQSNGSASAYTLPQAGASFPDKWFFILLNLGAGTATVTPTTSTINGVASMAFGQGEGAIIVSDGTNYTAVKFIANAAAGSIADDSVTNAKLANMATQTIKGRTTAGTGDPEDLTAAQATAILNAVVGDSGSGGTKGLVPAPGAGDAAAGKFLKADGTFAVPSGSGVGGSTGATDNSILRADGTGGSTLQNSAVLIDDNGGITVPEIAAPSTPASGKVAVYAKTDGKLYIKDDAGTETDLTGGGGSGSPGGADGDIQYRVDSSTFGGGPLTRLDANNMQQRNGANGQRLDIFRVWTSATDNEGLRLGRGDSADVVVGTFQGSGGGTAQTLKLHGAAIRFDTGTSSLTPRWEMTSSGFLPATTNQLPIGSDSRNVTQIHVRTGVMFNDGSTNVDSPKIIRTDASLEVKTLNDSAPTYLFLKDAGRKRVTAQFDKTNTTLADVTGLSESVRAGVAYSFEADLFIDADATGGFKFAIGGTATATSIIYQIQVLDNAADTYTINSRQTALAGSDGAAGPTAGYCRIKGTIVVNAAGTLTVQFAQNAANGTSSVLVNSTFRVEKF